MDIPFTYKTLDGKAYYCLSVFYARSGWPALLAQVLAFHAQQRARLDYCLAYLSEEDGGAHVRMTLASDVGQVPAVRREADRYFSEFLRMHPSRGEQPFAFGKELWLDFPVNSLLWNGYNLLGCDFAFAQSLTLLFPLLLDDDAGVDNAFSVALFLSVKMFHLLNSEQRTRLLPDYAARLLKGEPALPEVNGSEAAALHEAIASYREWEPEDAAYHRWLAIARERLAAGTRNTFGSLVADICRHLGLNDSHYLLILGCLTKGAE